VARLTLQTVTLIPTTITTTCEGAALAGADEQQDRLQPATASLEQFEQLVALHEPSVRRLAHRLLAWRSAADVDDVVQDVFLVLLKKLGSFRGEASLPTWLSAVTINRCRTQQRRQWFSTRLLRHRPPHFSEAVSPADEPALREEVSTRVRGAVQSLRGADREVIVLFYLEQLPSSEIATLLGISTGAVDVRLHRARRRLKEKLGDLMSE